CPTDSAVQNTAESVCGSGQKFAGSSDIGLAERSRSDQYIRLPSKRQRQQNFATDESRTNDPKSSAIIGHKKDTSRGYETSRAKLRSVGANIIPMAASLCLNIRIGGVGFLW